MRVPPPKTVKTRDREMYVKLPTRTMLFSSEILPGNKAVFSRYEEDKRMKKNEKYKTTEYGQNPTFLA